MPIERGRSFSEPRVKTPKQCPRFAIRMEYRGRERITPLPLTQDMIRQLALEAEFRGLNVGELVGGLVRATIQNNLVRQVLDPQAERPDPVRQPTAAQRGKKKPRRKELRPPLDHTLKLVPAHSDGQVPDRTNQALGRRSAGETLPPFRFARCPPIFFPSQTLCPIRDTSRRHRSTLHVTSHLCDWRCSRLLRHVAEPARGV